MMSFSLKQALDQAGLVVAPGVYDALTSILAVSAGARALYLSGASIAYSRFGRPDMGLVDMTEVAQIAAAITDRVETPLIVDGDNGWGNALNVQRMVRTFERAGAAAIQLEDQALPKRCGHLSDKRIIPRDEMAGKVRAACDARRNHDLLIIARVDAIAIEGLDGALDRAHAYAEAGADMLFVEAPRDLSEMRAIVASLGERVPLLANMIEGGLTPALSADELEDLGFRLAIFPGSAARAVAHQLRDLYRTIVTDGSTKGFRQRMLDFTELNAEIGTPDLISLGKRYEISSEQGLSDE